MRRVSRPSVTRDKRIAIRYAAGEAITAIAADERVDPKTVGNVARRAGLQRRRPDRSERNKRIVARYAAGERVQSIADSECVGRPYVRAVARQAGFPPRHGWQRRYPLEEAAFDHPTAVGWWLIGLLAADGCVTRTENRISLAQNVDDADVLRAFLDYVGCPMRPLTEIVPDGGSAKNAWAKRRQLEARVFSKQMCAALARHGVVPQKSMTMEFDEEAAREPAAWLGLFDGDGSGGLRSAHGRPRIYFYGAPPVMRQCSRFWGSKLSFATGGPPAVLKHSGKLMKVGLSGANAARAARIMLDSSPISLRRKRALLEDISRVRRHVAV